MSSARRATDLLLAHRDGDRQALNELMPLVYDELRAIARRKLRLERAGHTLDTNALAHEAYLRLVRLDHVQWESRAHFLAIAAQAMRNLLVNSALHRKRQKRGGGVAHVPLEDTIEIPGVEADRILSIHAALQKLAELNPRHERIVQCRFFSGMTIEETAEALGISIATAKRDWTLLRAWLQRELDGTP